LEKNSKNVFFLQKKDRILCPKIT
jgi:hypothetical protein